jgi:hypothetical protein
MAFRGEVGRACVLFACLLACFACILARGSGKVGILNRLGILVNEMALYDVHAILCAMYNKCTVDFSSSHAFSVESGLAIVAEGDTFLEAEVWLLLYVLESMHVLGFVGI